jgi:hypothetical protein
MPNIRINHKRHLNIQDLPPIGKDNMNTTYHEIHRRMALQRRLILHRQFGRVILHAAG